MQRGRRKSKPAFCITCTIDKARESRVRNEVSWSPSSVRCRLRHKLRACVPRRW
ncbi:hypothetical protein M3J09_005229 [Ascochyta lentis]